MRSAADPRWLLASVVAHAFTVASLAALPRRHEAPAFLAPRPVELAFDALPPPPAPRAPAPAPLEPLIPAAPAPTRAARVAMRVAVAPPARPTPPTAHEPPP